MSTAGSVALASVCARVGNDSMTRLRYLFLVLIAFHVSCVPFDFAVVTGTQARTHARQHRRNLTRGDLLVNEF